MPVLETVFFYIFAFGALLTSAVVAMPFRPFNNPLYSALALILDFFCFAGLYALLSAHFLAVTQILVYGGAIMVLFVFIIMLLNLREEEIGPVRFRVHHVLAVLVGFGFLVFSTMATQPLIDRQEVAQNRATAAERQVELEAQAAEAGEDADLPEVAIATPSAVPGLFADLNETALDAQYERQLARMREGTETPASRKYRTYQPDQKFELPPILEGRNVRGGPLGEEVSWGTVEPLSLLLVNRFVIPFELTAMLLLAAIVGAVIIAKKRL